MPALTAPPTGQHVQKRGGALQKFSVDKLHRAINAAFKDVHGDLEPATLELSDAVTHLTLKLLMVGPTGGKATWSVQRIEETVVRALGSLGLVKVASTYEAWRVSRAKVRAKRVPAMPKSAIGNYVQMDKYARHDWELGRREVKPETISRMGGMHTRKFPKLKAVIQRIMDRVRDSQGLPSMRTAQFAGPAIEASNSRLFNCLARETEFITSKGVKSFDDFEDGDITTVLTHKGEWKPATVRHYGRGQLLPLGIKRGNASYTVWATKDHRWFKHGGEVTDALKTGDVLMAAPSTFKEFDYWNASPMDRVYWCYGFVYGDGTRIKSKKGEYRHSMVRLCGYKTRYLDRFTECGFSSSSPASIKGDMMVYTGKYLKTLPDLEVDSPEMIRAFLRGILDADGTKNRNYTQGKSANPFLRIQSSSEETVSFLKRALPMVGAYIVSSKDMSGRSTNYGTHKYAVSLQLHFERGRNSNLFKATVPDDTLAREGELWCLEVEDHESFVLPCGVVTGNCISGHINSLRRFGEAFHWLLSGAGVGYSVQRRHTDLMAALASREAFTGKPPRSHKVEDTIEGWATALDFVVRCYQDGVHPAIDYSAIRALGAPMVTSGGRAPGPAPLRKALNLIMGVLDGAVGRRLRPFECHTILCHMADAVRAGGTRRAAMICLFDAWDEEILGCKSSFDWRSHSPWLERANNSAVLHREESPRSHFERVLQKSKAWGDPGFYWVSDWDAVCNPCVSADTWVTTSEGAAQVKDLVGKPFTSKLLGRGYDSNPEGFFETGRQELFRIQTAAGPYVDVTERHPVQVVAADGSLEWVNAGELVAGDQIQLGKDAGESAGARTTAFVSRTSLGMGLVYDCTIPVAHAFEANGLVVHNCAEIGLYPLLHVTAENLAIVRSEEPLAMIGDKVSGWQGCNLTSINAATCETPQDFYDRCRDFAILGTIQATYTKFTYQSQITRLLFEREALIGVSITGMQDNPAIALCPEVLRRGAQIVKDTNEEYAKILGINASPRCTTIKPEGTGSLWLGAVSPGIGPHHASHFFRRIVADTTSPLYQFFKLYNPEMCHERPGTNQAWITFCVQAPEGALLREDYSALKALEMIRMVTENWVRAGHRPEVWAPKGLTHSVSNTVTVKGETYFDKRSELEKLTDQVNALRLKEAGLPPEPIDERLEHGEWGELERFIWDHRDELNGIAVMGYYADAKRHDMPNQSLMDAADEAKWNAINKAYLDVPYEQFFEDFDSTDLQGEAACGAGGCGV